MNTKQDTTKKASAPETRTPRNLKPGTVVEDIYTGKINTVKTSYWQAYAGGNTSDYTVEFEPTQEQPTGWNKSTNLRVISTPETASASQNCAIAKDAAITGLPTLDPNDMPTPAQRRKWAKEYREAQDGALKLIRADKTAQGKPELPSIEQGATLGVLLEKHGKRTLLAEKPDGDAAYWRKRTDEYSLQLAKTHNHAEALAEALRDILFIARGAADYNNLNNICRITQEALANWKGVK